MTWDPAGSDLAQWSNRERLWLDVPFADKEAAKAAGARWEPGVKRWYDPAPDQSGRPRPTLQAWAALPDVPELLPGEDRGVGSGLFVDMVPSSCWFTNVRVLWNLTCQVSVLDQASGAVLAQVAVEAKSSEVAAFTTLLDNLDLTGVLITADAAHTNRNHAGYLHERGGHYLFTAKGNQPTLLRRLRALPWTQIGVAAREPGRDHGRVETRSISVVSLHPIPDLGGEFFPYAAQAIKVVRRRCALGSKAWTTVTVYAITSLTALQTNPVLLARWLRGVPALGPFSGGGQPVA